MSVRPATAKKQQAYLVELHDDEDLNDALKSSADMLRSEVSEVDKVTEEQVSLPVVIDVKTTAGGKGDPNTETGGEPQICCFTCYIGPCPEVINTNFKHPEFMICYRDDNSQCINGMMRYYCCPLYLATYKKDGEDTFELRAVQTETNIGASHAPNSGTNGYATGGASGPSSQGTNTHTSYHYYGGSGGGHPLHGMPSCHSFSQHHFNCRTMPPQFNFLHHCSCSCPPQMMAYCLNYRCQNGQAAAAAAAGMAPHAAAGQQYRQFAYHPPTYMYTTQGNSAMG